MYEQQEPLCRELGDKTGLQRALGNQGLVLRIRGNLEAAMTLYQQKEQICRELGDMEELALALANLAVVLTQMKRVEDAVRVVEQAERLMSDHGLAALAKRLQPDFDWVRAKLTAPK